MAGLYLMMGAALHRLAEVPAGGVCAILGFGTAVLKSATLSSSAFARPMRGMFFQAAPIVRVAIEEKADAIFMARELLREPYFPLKAAKALGFEIDYYPKHYQRGRV